jgi:hypothetical protein
MSLLLEVPPKLEATLRERAIDEGTTAQDLALTVLEKAMAEHAKPKRQRSVLDFEGVGAANPVGMDAQEYVNQLRDEWDNRP